MVEASEVTNSTRSRTPTIDGATSREEWLSSIDQLFAQIEGWATDSGWATLRDERQLDDERLGRYVAPVLLVHTPQDRFMLQPFARFTHQSDGVVDVMKYPSFANLAMLVRKGSRWYLQKPGKSAVGQVLSWRNLRQCFADAVEVE